MVTMVGIPGTAPKTRTQKIVGWLAFTAIMSFIVYVVLKNIFA